MSIDNRHGRWFHLLSTPIEWVYGFLYMQPLSLSSFIVEEDARDTEVVSVASEDHQEVEEQLFAVLVDQRPVVVYK